MTAPASITIDRAMRDRHLFGGALGDDNPGTPA
jgi:hypothetical protein